MTAHPQLQPGMTEDEFQEFKEKSFKLLCACLKANGMTIRPDRTERELAEEQMQIGQKYVRTKYYQNLSKCNKLIDKHMEVNKQ